MYSDYLCIQERERNVHSRWDFVLRGGIFRLAVLLH